MINQTVSNVCFALSAGLSIFTLADITDVPSATPVTILGAFITVSVGTFTLMGWTLRKLIEINQNQQNDYHQLKEQFLKDTQANRESIIELKNCLLKCLERCAMSQPGRKESDP